MLGFSIYRWVSKYGNEIPYTILKIIFANKKNIFAYFINILKMFVEKEAFFHNEFEDYFFLYVNSFLFLFFLIC